ncbi:hypothetical protein BV898_17705 [Hypsibius exemplaris]|uniref:Uncharacterized protein n=1 Tax=Hypsibius exemplaris TaxID=2072580 RepID=A0A9X6RN20_HYPEX|nr:hypothetical protein BV898_17705 [Hypsibius exemplaris]
MDYSAQFPHDWMTVAVSGCLSIFFTVVYIFFTLGDFQPLFYLFSGLALSIAGLEYGAPLLHRVLTEESVAALRTTLDSAIAAIDHSAARLARLRREQKLTFTGTVCAFFVALFLLARQMDDAALVYAACMLLSASPLIRKLFGQSTQQFADRASQLFQEPPTEATELADYMPTINEISRDFSFRHRKNTNDSNATDRELMDVSVFGEEAFANLETSAVSLLNESNFGFALEQQAGGQLSSRTTDDDISPIPSDVEVIDADDIPTDFPSVSSINSGRIMSDAGSYTASGTLRRHRKSSKELANHRKASDGRDSSVD